MVKYKNIRIKKKGGGSRLQRVQVLASGKYKFVKNKTKSKSSVVRRKTTKLNPKRRKPRKMAKRKKKRGSRKFTIPIAVVVGTFAGFATPPKGREWSPIDAVVKHGDWGQALNNLAENYTGFSPQQGNFDGERLLKGLGPLIAGFAVHKIAGMLGINRALGRAKIPFIRI